MPRDRIQGQAAKSLSTSICPGLGLRFLSALRSLPLAHSFPCHHASRSYRRKNQRCAGRDKTGPSEKVCTAINTLCTGICLLFRDPTPASVSWCCITSVDFDLNAHALWECHLASDLATPPPLLCTLWPFPLPPKVRPTLVPTKAYCARGPLCRGDSSPLLRNACQPGVAEGREAAP